MAIKTYIAVSRTYRAGRVLEIGDTVPLDEDLATGDATLDEAPAWMVGDKDTPEGAPSGIADAKPQTAEPEPDRGAQAASEDTSAAGPASLAPETGEADGSGATDAAPPADQALPETATAETRPPKSKAKKAE
jgi:hypothetical protein